MFNPLNSATSRSIINNIARATKDLGTSLERLSSGKRINGPNDGAADYSIVTRLQTQMRGITSSIQNVNDANGLATTASASLDSMLTTAYHLREIAQKAMDANLTTTERNALQDEANGYLSDLQTMVSTTKYNNTNLLDGTFGTKTLQVGPNYGDNFSFSIGDARTVTLGRLAIYSGAQGAISAGIGSSNSVLLNGVTIYGSQPDLVSTSGSSYSALSIVNAINAQQSSTNVQAEVIATRRTIAIETQNFSSVSGFSGTFGSGEFKINSVTISGTISTASNLVSRINAYTSQTGVAASFDSSNNIVLTAADGRNIEVIVSNGAANRVYEIFNVSTNNGTVFTNPSTTLSVGVDQTYVGAIRLWSSSAISISGTNPSLALGIASGSQSLTGGTAVQSMSLSSTTNASQALKVLDATIDQISTLRAQVDAVHSRLDHSASFLLSEYNAASEAKDSIGGADFAMETANLVMAQLLQNTGLAALTQANLSQSLVAKLLKD
ncbi:MAG: hypothetical protein J0L93_09000 [Deltaproteobacteria bacterium]|nr:hypothetical protein [Deltaproteobacteria bacterium]